MTRGRPSQTKSRGNRHHAFFVATAAVFFAAASHADAPTRHKLDVRDVALLPSAARAAFERGEALLEAGDFAGAMPLFEEVAASAPDNAIAFRRLCEALTGLGRRDEAIKTCLGAMARRGTPMDFRAYVGALTSGSAPITPDDMSQAVVFARRAREIMPEQPWGYAAQCDIAHRLGDTAMLNDCIQHLKRIAPDHRETARAMALAAPSGRYRIVAGWILLTAACLGTLMHALWRARTRRLTRANAVVLGCWLAGVMMAMPTPAGAENAKPAANQAVAPAANSATEPPDMGQPPVPGAFSEFSIDDEDPLKSIPPPDKLHRNPLQFGYYVMDLTDRGEKATERGDHAAAVKYFQALAKITPDHSVAFARMCASYEALGMLEKAVYSCGAAIERPGATIKDYMRFVGLSLSKKGNLTSGELAALDKVVEHLRADEHGKGIADELACRIGVRVWSAKRLEPCTAALAAHAPNHPDTVYFQWALAATRGNASEARALIARARELSLKAEDVRQMEMATEKLESRWKNYIGIALGMLLVMVCGAALVASRRRPSAEPKNPAPSSAAA